MLCYKFVLKKNCINDKSIITLSSIDVSIFFLFCFHYIGDDWLLIARYLFQGSTAISSADLFGQRTDHSAVDVTASELINRLSFQVRLAIYCRVQKSRMEFLSFRKLMLIHDLYSLLSSHCFSFWSNFQDFCCITRHNRTYLPSKISQGRPGRSSPPWRPL